MPKVGSSVHPCCSRSTKWGLGEELRVYPYPWDGWSSICELNPPWTLCVPQGQWRAFPPWQGGCKDQPANTCHVLSTVTRWEGGLGKHHMPTGRGAALEIWLLTQMLHYLHFPAALSDISANPAKTPGWQQQGCGLPGHVIVQMQPCLASGASAVLSGQAAQAEPLFTRGCAINSQFTGAQWTGSPVTTFL